MKINFGKVIGCMKDSEVNNFGYSSNNYDIDKDSTNKNEINEIMNGEHIRYVVIDETDKFTIWINMHEDLNKAEEYASLLKMEFENNHTDGHTIFVAAIKNSIYYLEEAAFENNCINWHKIYRYDKL